MLTLNGLKFWNVNKRLSLLSLTWDKCSLLTGCWRSLSLTMGLLLSVNSSQHSSLSMAAITLNLLPIIRYWMALLKGQSKLLSLPWRNHTYHFLSGCHSFYFAITSPLTLQLDTPAEMLMSCQLRSRLSLMLPNASQKIYPSQNRQKQSHDQHSKMIMFYSGDAVFVCNVCNKTLAWLQGSIVSQTGHYLKRSSLTITASLVITCITSDVDLVIIQTVKTPLILLLHLRTNHLLHQIQLDQVDQWNLVHTQWVQQYLANLPESIYHLTDTHPHREGV